MPRKDEQRLRAHPKRGVEILIKKNVTIGALDAETDTEFIRSCFVEGTDYQCLVDSTNPRAIVLGRTGAGKTALLIRIEDTQENVVRLDPNDFSFRYIENSNIIRFFEELGVNLDLFYRFLWRHVLSVELLKKRYDIRNVRDQQGVFTRLDSIFARNPAKKKAIDYVRQWGDKFWEETEIRVRELLQKVETDWGASIEVGVPSIKSGVTMAEKLTEEQREEIKKRASTVVSSIQMKQLGELTEFLADDVFCDMQKRYYVLIDQLDENWAATEMRCRLIRALIEEIKTFRKIETAKIIVALRSDLLTQVFDATRDSGFQEEKYDAYMLRITWTEQELKYIVEKRLNYVFEHQYVNARIGIDEIFPSTKGGQRAIDFIIERTFRRPRDIIQFVNECLALAVDRPRISWDTLRAAEANYSEKRLRSLYEEWAGVYPALQITVTLLVGLHSSFTHSSIPEERVEEVITKLCEGDERDPGVKLALRYFNQGKPAVSEASIRHKLLQCLYHVGVIGIKTSAAGTFSWSYLDQPTVSEGEVKRCTHMRIHKMFWRALDVVSE
jgi:hypothetical protein